MRSILSRLLIVLVTASASLAAPGVKVERDISYIPDGDPAQKLDIYLPDPPSEKPLPLVIWIHGGGWSGGSKSGTAAAQLVHHGYASASIEYRFSQKAVFPAQIQDCQAAIRWLRANSRKYNFDPDHIGVWGDSAGGHLVALVGTSGGKNAFPKIGENQEQSDRVQAVCDWYGPTDFMTVMQQAADDKNAKNIFNFNHGDPYSQLIGGKLGEDRAKCEAVSPVTYVSKENPPFLIMHGTKDALVPLAQSEELLAALQKAGVDALLQKFPGAGHGGPEFGLPAVQELIRKFFDRHLKGEDVKVEVLPDEEVMKPGSHAAAGGSDLFTAERFADSSGASLPYRFMKPAAYDPAKKYPVVLFFHGAGERGDDNLIQLKNGVGVFATAQSRQKFPCFVIAPQCPQGKQWVDVPWSADSEEQPAQPSQWLQMTLAVLDQTQKQYSIDPDRVYVTGLSMGGYATWDLITRFPGKFAAAVPVCGGGDEKQASKIAMLPIWAFHGDSDTVVKTLRSRTMIQAIKDAGGTPKYTEYPGVGHNSWDKAYAEPDLLPWMFAQHRVAN